VPDGKTENAQHVLALDPFTLAALKAHVEQLEHERRDFGPDYHDHGVLFCWPGGRPPHPDTITRRFMRCASVLVFYVSARLKLSRCVSCTNPCTNLVPEPGGKPRPCDWRQRR